MRLTLVLDPAVILADGKSTTTATATVKDALGHPVPGNDKVTFASTDPHDKIGLVTAHGDGTYTATITGSTTSGSPTITATDHTTALSPATVIFVHTANRSTTALTALPGSVVTNQAVTLIATVTSITNATSPSGSVVFYLGKTPVASCGTGGFVASGQTGVVTCRASFVAPVSPVQAHGRVQADGRLERRCLDQPGRHCRRSAGARRRRRSRPRGRV